MRTYEGGQLGKTHIFGPIASRRLGRSLGVDVLPLKTCPFDCVYCEVGRTTRKTGRRRTFVPADEVLAELAEFFRNGGQAEYVTFSGSGEPTLYAGLGRLVAQVRRRFGVKVAVITNSALLSRPRVRAELMGADIVMPSLDSAREESFRAVNRPIAGISAGKVVEGLVRFAREFKGRMWLEVLLVEGANDSDADIDALAAAVKRIVPERVQLNTVVRPPAEAWARPVTRRKLERIAARLSHAAPAEVIARVAVRRGAGKRLPGEKALVETLKRRPCTVEDLAGGFSADPGEMAALLRGLVRAGKARRARFAHGDFYEAPDLHVK